MENQIPTEYKHIEAGERNNRKPEEITTGKEEKTVIQREVEQLVETQRNIG